MSWLKFFVSITKGALAPFFVVCALSFCLLTPSRGGDYVYWWQGLCLLIALLSLQQRQFALSWISLALAGFCGLLLVNTLYLNPVYHADGIYFPATLLLAFLAASRYADWLAQTGFKIFCAFIALIAVWALVQWLAGWGFLDEKSARSVALFVTPNTLATVLNLGLLPILGFYLLGCGGRSVYMLVLLLFAALLATQSRGGYLGLLAGILFLVSFVGQASVIAQLQRYRKIAVGFIAVFGFFKFYAWLGLADWSLDNVAATLSHGDSSFRWEIYQAAWAGLAEHPWLGIGYHNFRYYFEAHKVSPFLDSTLLFVHNDYLQFALETGLPGLGLFLLLIAVVYGQLIKLRRQAMVEQRLPLILSAAAITSMLVHALVDFPFYITVLQAVFGAYLGVINRCIINMGARQWLLPKMPEQGFLGLSPGFINNMPAVGLMVWLGLPAFADVSAGYGLARLQHDDAQHGLYGYAVARTLQPRNADYYRQEGLIWKEQGVALAKLEWLEKSVAAFDRGIEVNPYGTRNLLTKIALYREHGTLFKQPASHQDIMTWINQAKSLRPHSYDVQMEYVHCLDFVGEYAQSIEQAKILLRMRPQSKAAQKLLESVSRN